MEYRLYSKSEKATDRQHLENEDSYIFSEMSFMKDQPVRLLVVADGMGGLMNGKTASLNAVKGFVNSFCEEMLESYMGADMEAYSLKYMIKDIKKSLQNAIQIANNRVCEGAKDYEMTGTTISAVCLVDDCAVIANVGDSPVYFYRKDDRCLKLLSKQQTKAEQDVEAGLYERYSNTYFDNNHILYCSLGQYNYLQEDDIYVTAIGNLKKGDRILVGSDGCFGYLNDCVLKSLLNECRADEEGFFLEQLFSLARMDKDDDQTAFLYVVA